MREPISVWRVRASPIRLSVLILLLDCFMCFNNEGLWSEATVDSLSARPD